MDKRKGIILAIVLFLIIGLGSFVFAGQSDEFDQENGTKEASNNGGDNENDGQTTTPSKEEPGESEGEGGNTQTAGGNRGNGGGNQIANNGDDDEDDSYADVLALIEELEKQVADAKNKNDLNNATDYRDENTVADKINDLADGTNKTDLQNRLDEINKILNDSEAPVVTGIENGTFTNKNVTIGIEESDVIITLNGKEVTIDDLKDLNADDEYTLVVTDKAFNSTEVVFTIDQTNPVFTGIQNGHQYQEVTIGLTEKNIGEVEIYNRDLDKYYEFEEGMVLDEDGTYTAVATDKAGNTTGTVYFEVDGTAPVIIINGEKVEPTDETLYYNETIVITVDEKNLASFTSNGSDRTSSVLADGWTAEGESGYKLVLTDKAGNETTYTVVIDKTEIAVNHLYVLNNSHNDSDYNLTDENRYKVVGVGQKLYFEYVLKEEFTSTPVLTIGGQEFKMDCGTASWNDSLYKCDAHVTINSDMSLTNGKVIPFEITGVKDIAGNETTVTEENVTVTEKYGQVIYDGKAPKYNQLGILNVDHLRNDEDITVAKYGDEIRVLFHFTEELAVNPKMTIGESKKVYELELNENYDNFKEYTYVADITLTEDMNLTDGALVYTIYGYADAAGNVGKTIKSTDEIKAYTKYPGVEIDNTAPTRGYSTLGFEYTDNSDKTSVEINGEKVYYVKPGDSFLYKIAFSEKIQDGLIATIAGTDVSLEYLDYSEDLGYIYGGTYTVPSGLTEGERLEIVVSNIKDLAGNEYVDGTIVDVPTSNGRVAEFDNTPIKYNAVNFYVDNNEYQDGNTYYATYGSTLVAYIRTNELLKENPTFEFTYGDEKIVISGEDVEFIDEEKEEFTYLYRVRYTILEDFEKIEEEVTLNITNIVDYAGNITDNGSTGITNSNRVFIDTLAPQVVELRFNSSNDNKNYANENHSVGIYLVVDEELAENPVFTINGIQYKMTEQKEVANGYFYAATTKLPADTEEGKLSFTITNVVDEFGNSTSFDNDDIKNNVGYNYVIFDTTDPVITKKVDTDLYLPEGSKLPELSDLISATDNIDGDVTANAYIHRYTNEGDYYFLEIYVKDACGNGEYPSSYAAFRIHFVTENNQTSVDSAELSTVSNTKNNEPSNGAIVGAIVNSFSEDCLMTDAI